MQTQNQIPNKNYNSIALANGIHFIKPVKKLGNNIAVDPRFKG